MSQAEHLLVHHSEQCLNHTATSCLLWRPVVLLTVLLSSDTKAVEGRECAPGLKRSGNGNEDASLLTSSATPSHGHTLLH